MNRLINIPLDHCYKLFAFKKDTEKTSKNTPLNAKLQEKYHHCLIFFVKFFSVKEQNNKTLPKKAGSHYLAAKK